MMNSIPRHLATILCAVLTLALSGCGDAPAPAANQNDANLALYREVMNRVRASYVEPVRENELVTNSLKGMLDNLDPHSDYMTEPEYHEMLDDSEGRFAGIGAELTRDDDHPRVIAPIEDTPAARAGIRSGDTILKINGKLTDGMSLQDVVDQLRGPEGTTVVVTIGRRNLAPFNVTLTRAIIHVASVKWRLEPGRIGYARITSFAENTQRELSGALDKMTRQAGGHLDGFVLDLRNNPGGLLDEAVRVAGDFLDGGVVVSTHGRDEDDDRVYDAPSRGDRLKGVPMVVLVNGASASASEIVAGALQDRHRATILGTPSFGKGSVQTIIPLDGHGALRLTTALYYTPSGRSIQGRGIIPNDIVSLPKSEATPDAEVIRESDLRGALKPEPASAAANAPSLAARSAEKEGSIDPAIIGTARDTQLKTALAEVRMLMTRPVARSQSVGSR